MYKKLLIVALVCLLIPGRAFAAPVSWDFTSNVLQPLRSGWGALIKGDHFQATSTTASIFPYASTTALSATTLCLSTDCRTVWPSGSGGAGTVSTSSSETSGRIPFWTTTGATPALLSGGAAGFTWDNTLSKLTATNASTTNLSIGSLSGILKQSGGVVSAAVPGTDYLTGNQTITLSGDVSGSGSTAITTTIGALKVLNSMVANGTIDLTTKVTGILPVANGGTGSSTLSGILIGNGTSPVNTLTIGSNLSLVGTTLSATASGGTGLATTSPISGSNVLVYSSAGAGSAYGAATTSATCAGTVSCTSFNVLGSSPITITGSGGGGGSFPFSADTNYGQVVYSTSTPTLWFKSGLFASSTSQIAYASTTAISVTGVASSSLFLAAPGTSGAPSYAFSGGPTSGFYLDTATSPQTLYVQTSGNNVFRFNSNGSIAYAPISGLNAKTFLLRADAGAVSTPTYSFANDTDTGIWSSGADLLSFTTGGADRVNIAAGGNVGVSSSSPFAKLSIHANNGDTNTDLFNIGSSTASATTTLFNVQNTGNVGIGTTTPAATLSIQGAGAATNAPLGFLFKGGTGGVGIGGGATILGGVGNIGGGGAITIAGGSSTGSAGGNIIFDGGVGGVGNGNIILNSVNTNSNVGVGTSTPFGKLSVAGNLQQYGAYAHFGTAVPLYTEVAQSAIGLWGTDNTTNGVQFTIGNTSNGASAYSGINLLNSDANSNLTNFAGIYKNGPNYTDTTFGTGVSTKNLLLLQNTLGPTSFVNSSTTLSATYFNWLAQGTAQGNEIARLTGDGNFGLGTTSPHAELSVNAGSTSPTKNLLELSYSTGAANAATTTAFSLASSTSGTLLIGTTTPANGSQSATTTIYMQKLQFQGGNSAGVTTCAYVNSSNAFTVQAGPCN